MSVAACVAIDSATSFTIKSDKTPTKLLWVIPQTVLGFCNDGTFYGSVNGKDWTGEPCSVTRNMAYPVASAVEYTIGSGILARKTVGTLVSVDNVDVSPATPLCQGAPAVQTGVDDGNVTLRISCPPGRYYADGRCKLAYIGGYSAGADAVASTPCAPGSFSDKQGASQCTLAPAGSFAAGPGASAAGPCPAGHFSATAGAAACTPADPGYFVRDSDRTQQIKCPIGSYSAAAGAAACTAADVGHYVDTEGATQQTACPQNQNAWVQMRGNASSAQCVSENAQNQTTPRFQG